MSVTVSKLHAEIEKIIAPKLFNLRNGTATDREKQVVAECQGFLCLLRFSVLSEKELKQLWENSGMAYQ